MGWYLQIKRSRIPGHLVIKVDSGSSNVVDQWADQISKWITAKTHDFETNLAIS